MMIGREERKDRDAEAFCRGLQHWGERIEAHARALLQVLTLPAGDGQIRDAVIEAQPRKCAERLQILFLASDEANFMTGSVVLLDGGYTAQ
jgi:hypothetical protein